MNDFADLRRLVREGRRAERFTSTALCYDCGEADPIVLVAGSAPLRCYECTGRSAGRSRFEGHHVAGLGCGPTVLIPANVHRRLSQAEYDRAKPPRTRPRAPLQELHASLCGLVALTDALDGFPGATFTPPAGATVLTVPVAAAPGFRWIAGTDRSWFRESTTAPWQPCPRPYRATMRD
jgi:hypothetical protein